MSLLLYNISIFVLSGCYRIASFFNPKARQFVSGRRGQFAKLKALFKNGTHRWVWVHCASLGEFEQGRPIIEAIKHKFPDVKILLTFFSPSGYENKKDYKGADAIFYLPWDTPTNAKKFVDIVNPTLTIFVKYEFWYNYTAALKRKGTALISVSCILRPEQPFFKSYGGIFRRMLNNFDHFFAQNKETINLLARLNIKATLAGDTRFDRVYQITKLGSEIEGVKKFKNDDKILVAGSCWPEDMELLYPIINNNNYRLKFIIAPHEISEGFLEKIENSLMIKSIRYSQIKDDIANFKVLIIDNVGMLSRLYRYGEFAYVGGAFGTGLHNILEPASYGIPIFFGDRNYQKFQEANDLIMRGGAFEVSGYAEFKEKYELLNNYPENFLLACEVTRSYVMESLGATQKIMDYCTTHLTKA
jgi:3-deoxy-D-manno-octulosonic-acid transferase